jgi:Micro-tubular organiser Mto1 C-term Mto2-binding region
VLRDRESRETPSPSRTAVTHSSGAATTSTNASPSQASPGNPSNEKRWLLRFQELENRLKAEQEGRALDQKGAKIRLDEVRKENAELRNEIKEKEGSGGSSSGSIQMSKEPGRDGNSV